MARVNLTYVFLQIFLTILFVFLYDSCYAFSYPKVTVARSGNTYIAHNTNFFKTQEYQIL